MTIYFPEGRTAGKRAIVTAWRGIDDYGPPNKTLVLDQDLGATGLSFWFPTSSWSEESDFYGRLLSSSGSVEGETETDEPHPWPVPITFCNSGKEPREAVLQYVGPAAFPLSRFAWKSNVPLDRTSVPSAPVSVGGKPFESAVVISDFELSFDATGLPPGASPNIDLSSLKDIVGRPVRAGEVLSVLTTKAVLTDLTFATTVPSDAIATDGANFSVDQGLLWIHASLEHTKYEALIALGEPTNKTIARIQIYGDCERRLDAPRIVAALVSANGASVEVVTCAGRPSNPPPVDVALPGPGPLWLAIRSDTGRSVAIDSISFQ